MKILFSCLSKSWGGMEMVTLTGIKQLLEKHENVELLCINESRIHIEANSLGIMIHPITIYGKLHPFASLKTAAIIKTGNYDIIHTHASKDLWIIVPALNFLKSTVPLFLTKHVGSFIVKKDFLHKKLYNRVTAVLAISNAIKKNLLDTLPIDEERIILLHNGIDTAKFSPERTNPQKIRQEFNIADNELLIGMLARFSPGKGHEEFITATARLSKLYNHLRFIVVGEASRGEESYAETIKKDGLSKVPGLIFTGYRGDTPDVLSAMDIFVFPSHSESFGIALVEAMAAGVPSVCSNSEGVPDIAVNNETSLFFRTKDADDLFTKLQILINSEELRQKLGAASIKRAVGFFDLEKHMKQLLDIYRSAQIK